MQPERPALEHRTWPRQYARQILAMKTREERAAALQHVPDDWRELVATHVQIAWNHPNGGKTA